jgi:peptide/nickel transport system substrate-binding protein
MRKEVPMTQHRRAFLRRTAAASLGLAAPNLGSSPAFAQTAPGGVLVVALRSQLPNFDQYMSTSRDAVIITRHLFDMLIERDPETFTYRPALATEWRWIDPQTLELALREGVTFHNGQAFTADDVVGTLTHYANPAAQARQQQAVNWIERVEKLGTHRVRIVAKRPFPAAIEFLAGSLPIYPFAYFTSVGQEEFGRRPVGSGPYRLGGQQGLDFTLERFDGHYQGSPKGQAAIATVRVRTIPDEATRIAELLSGNVHWIWEVAPDQIDRLEGRRGISVARAETMRITFLLLDVIGRTGPNPLQDQRVRQAIAHAIDRPRLVQRLVGGNARVVHGPCFPTQVGCDLNGVREYAYDPARARALLADAGHANGFETGINFNRSRPRAEAVQAMLGHVGIRATLTQMQPAASFNQWREGRTPIWYGEWGSFSINDASASISNFFKGGPNDGARDEEVMRWLTVADTSVDPDERRRNYRLAIDRIVARAYMVPMYTVVANYAFTDRLVHQAFADEIPRWYLFRWR